MDSNQRPTRQENFKQIREPKEPLMEAPRTEALNFNTGNVRPLYRDYGTPRVDQDNLYRTDGYAVQQPADPWAASRNYRPQPVKTPPPGWNVPGHTGHHVRSDPRMSVRPVKPGLLRGNPWTVYGTIVAVLVVIGMILVLLVSHKDSADTSIITIQSVSAGQVAAELHGTDFQEKDASGNIAGVVTVGTFMKDGVKYAVNTFANNTVRDNWIKTTAVLGVQPKWEGTSWVAYKSIGDGKS
jgi:hypothetical protein